MLYFGPCTDFGIRINLGISNNFSFNQTFLYAQLGVPHNFGFLYFAFCLILFSAQLSFPPNFVYGYLNLFHLVHCLIVNRAHMK